MIFYTILALGLPSLLYYIYAYLKETRSLFLNLPSLKRTFLFGNILEMGKYVKNDRHPGTYCVLSHSCSFIYGCLLSVVTLAKPVTSNIITQTME
jgi:hypothetical protein